MKKPSALKAWKFFKKKFNASGQDAEAIVNLISSVNLLRGMYFTATIDRAQKRGESAKERDQSIEDMSHSRFSVSYVLLQFFGIDRVKYTDFDPIELSDSLGYDPRVAKLFKKKGA